MVLIIICLLTNTSSCSSWLLELINALLTIHIMPFIGHLNNSITGPGSPGPSEVDHFCNNAICISDLVSIHF